MNCYPWKAIAQENLVLSSINKGFKLMDKTCGFQYNISMRDTDIGSDSRKTLYI